MVADQAADPAGGVLVVDAGADEFDGGRRPQFGHPGLAPHGLALGQGLQDGDRQDAAGPVVGVQLGQVTDRCHGRGLVQDGDQGRVQPPAAGFGQVHPGAQHPVGQGRDQGGRGPAGVLAQQVEGAGPVDEPVGVQSGQWSPRWGDPGGDRRVAQAAGPGAGGEVDAGPGLVGHVRVPAHGPGEHVEPAGLQGGGRGGVVLVGQPFVDLGDRGAGEVGGQEQPGQQLGGAHRPDRVLLVLDRGDEVPGQAFGLLDGGDAGQGVPPPGLRGAGHALRVEHPRLQPGHVRAQPGGVEDVELVAGGDHRTRVRSRSPGWPRWWSCPSGGPSPPGRRPPTRRSTWARGRCRCRRGRGPGRRPQP